MLSLELSWITDLCPPERPAKLSKKLQNWWQHDFTTFRKEIKRLYKQDIPLLERTDWEDWINKERENIQKLDTELSQQEDELNKQVYGLFDLTEDEIELLEKVT